MLQKEQLQLLGIAHEPTAAPAASMKPKVLFFFLEEGSEGEGEEEMGRIRGWSWCYSF